MAGRAQRRDVVGTEVLHLVDEHRDALAHVGGQAAEVGEQLDQVDLDVAGVGAALDRRGVDAGVPLLAQLGVRAGLALGEGLDHAEDVVDVVGLRVAELADRLVQRAGQRPAQPLVGAGLELAGPPATPYGRRAEGVEQHGLADPPQPGEHQAALGTPAGDPLQHHVEGAQLLVTAGQLGRALPRAGGVRVPDRVHDPTLSACLAISLDFPIECPPCRSLSAEPCVLACRAVRSCVPSRAFLRAEVCVLARRASDFSRTPVSRRRGAMPGPPRRAARPRRRTPGSGRSATPR